MIPFFQRLKLYLNNYQDYLAIGDCYANGIAVETNLDLAIWCYQQVILKNTDNQQVSMAYYSLGEIYNAQNRINLALKCYFYAAITANNEEAKQMLNSLEYYSLIGLYYLAKLDERDNLLENAFKLYKTITTKIALYDLEKEAKALSYYKLGCLYETLRNNKTKKAFDCYKKSALYGDKYALDAIEQNKTSSKYASFILAEFYMNGLAYLHKNVDKAISLYKTSSRLGNIEATIFLGNYSRDIQKDYPLAFSYFFAASMQDPVSPMRSYAEMQTLLPYLENSQYIYQLACLYYEANMIDQTIHLYDQLMDKEFNLMLKNNIKVKFKDSNLLYLFAEHYLDKDELKAIYHYYQASIIDHEQSLINLKNIANADNRYALRFLGLYYKDKDQLLEAGKCWIRADFLHDQQSRKLLANTSFDKQICLELARLYEENILVPQNLNKALRFYLRSQTQDLDMIVRIGNKLLNCCNDESNLQRNFKISTWNCFVYLAQVALNLSNNDFWSLSLKTLENLAQNLDATFQYKLANLYLKEDNFYKYDFWIETAKKTNLDTNSNTVTKLPSNQPLLTSSPC